MIPTPSSLSSMYGSLCLAGLVLLAPSAPTRSDDLDDAQREAVVERIAEELEAKYVFPDVAERCGEHLRDELAAGEFDDLTQPRAFAAALTKALQSISEDKHMRVRMRRPASMPLCSGSPP